MIYYGIVIYNKKIIESASYNSLIYNGIENAEIIIFDNSNNKQCINENKIFTFDRKMKYIGKGENRGLSFAYNAMIEFLRQYAKSEDYFVTLDDDTTITAEYVQEIKTATRNNKFAVCIPIVIANSMVLSPSNVYYFGKIRPIQNLNQLQTNRLTAINTGVCYKLSCFDKVKFNEMLFLDCVDHCMFRDIRKNKLQVYIMEKAKIYQQYSRDDNPSCERRLNRFKITTKDVFNYSKISPVYSIFFCISELRQAAILSKKYGTMIFLKEYLNVWRIQKH